MPMFFSKLILSWEWFASAAGIVGVDFTAEILLGTFEVDYPGQGLSEVLVFGEATAPEELALEDDGAPGFSVACDFFLL